MKLLYFCQHDPLWLDAYGTWRCEICFPPIYESEVRERKNSSGKKPVEKIQSTEISPAEKNPTEEISLVRFLPQYFFNDEFLWDPQNQEPPCEVCQSLDFWWDLLNTRHCRRCNPKPPKRSRELLEFAQKLRLTAERARLAEVARLAKLAKSETPAN